MLLRAGLDVHQVDKDVLKKIGWYEERKKMSDCIKEKPLSIQKAILRAYKERYVMRDEKLNS